MAVNRRLGTRKKGEFSGSHAPAWESIQDAPASRCSNVLRTLARPNGIPTPARGNEKIIYLSVMSSVGWATGFCCPPSPYFGGQQKYVAHPTIN